MRRFTGLEEGMEVRTCEDTADTVSISFLFLFVFFLPFLHVICLGTPTHTETDTQNELGHVTDRLRLLFVPLRIGSPGPVVLFLDFLGRLFCQQIVIYFPRFQYVPVFAQCFLLSYVYRSNHTVHTQNRLRRLPFPTLKPSSPPTCFPPLVQNTAHHSTPQHYQNQDTKKKKRKKIDGLTTTRFERRTSSRPGDLSGDVLGLVPYPLHHPTS